MSSKGGGDQYPLLLVVNNIQDDPLKKPPLPPQQSIRDHNVTMGAATVLSRWPQHVTTTSRIAMITALAVLSMSLFSVATVIYFTDTSTSSLLPHEQNAVMHKTRRHRPPMCDVIKRHAADLYETADVDALISYMSPLETAVEFLNDRNKIFFIVTQGELMTEGKQCAIASAVRANQDSTIYLLIFTDKAHERLVASSGDNRTTQISNQVSTIYVNADEYFRFTPLGVFWNEVESNNTLKLLAAKLVTLWRFGGLSLDLRVLSLHPALLPRQRCKNANVDLNGLVLGTKQPCHAFLFETMMILSRMQREAQLANVTMTFEAGAALTAARDLYCTPPRCKSIWSKRKCHSVNMLSPRVVCDEPHIPQKGHCIWLPYKETDMNDANFKSFCTPMLKKTLLDFLYE